MDFCQLFRLFLVMNTCWTDLFDFNSKFNLIYRTYHGNSTSNTSKITLNTLGWRNIFNSTPPSLRLNQQRTIPPLEGDTRVFGKTPRESRLSFQNSRSHFSKALKSDGSLSMSKIKFFTIQLNSMLAEYE